MGTGMLLLTDRAYDAAEFVAAASWTQRASPSAESTWVAVFDLR